MTNQPRLIQLLTGLCFVLLMTLGLWLAAHRCLWNDEYFSIISSTLENSYKSIFLGAVKEGNNSPLFYIMQKIQCDLFSYHAPDDWFHARWQGVHVFDQVFLRLQSVLWLSAALSFLFYYFSKNYSIIAGIYALAVTMTSSLFWFHWTEARPYAGWFALSLFQLICLLDICADKKKSLLPLFIINVFLALIATLSGVQIIAAVILVWMFRSPRWIWHVLLLVVPLSICTFYYTVGQHFYLFFVDGPVALISANLPKDRLLLIIVSAVALAIFQRHRWKELAEIRYLVFLVLVMAGYGLLMLKLKCTPPETHGFQVSSRYFIPLVPIGIVGTTLFSISLIKAMPAKYWRIAVVLVLAAFFAYRTHRTIQFFPHDYHLGPEVT